MKLVMKNKILIRLIRIKNYTKFKQIINCGKNKTTGHKKN